jgi:anti-sigma regulatory factor (Ser/Thr protein kinase)
VSFIETFKSMVPADPGVLFQVRQSLRGWLHTAEFGSEAIDAMVLAVHEAVANGIEHGGGSPVRVEGRAEDGDLVVEVTTKGAWKAGSEGDGALAERGRGLALMRALTKLELLVGDGCVTIRLRPLRT